MSAAAERVLVTGFCDWQRTLDGGRPGDPWSCVHNPSGRLLVGELGAGAEPYADPPLVGPLVRSLAQRGSRRHAFRLLPVVWGAHGRLGDPGDYDVLVHLGLGVYDRRDALQLERGAFPWRRGTDALGEAVDEALSGPTPAAPRLGPAEVLARIDALEGSWTGDFEVRVAAARPDNVFLCNETHWHALGAASRGAAARAYFVHIPLVEGPPGLDTLAVGLAELIARL